MRNTSLRTTGPTENPRDTCHQTKNSTCPGWRLKVSVQSQAGKKTKVKYWGPLESFFLLMCDIGCPLCKHNFKTNLQPLLPTTLLTLSPSIKKSWPLRFLSPHSSFLPVLPQVTPLPVNRPSFSANLKPSSSLKFQCQNCTLRPLEANKSPSSGLGNVLCPLPPPARAPPVPAARSCLVCSGLGSAQHQVALALRLSLAEAGVGVSKG